MIRSKSCVATSRTRGWRRCRIATVSIRPQLRPRAAADTATTPVSSGISPLSRPTAGGPGAGPDPGRPSVSASCLKPEQGTWLAEGSSSVQQQALRYFDRAMKSFFEKPAHFGFPTWRKAGLHEGFCVRDVTVKRFNRKWASIVVPKVGPCALPSVQAPPQRSRHGPRHDGWARCLAVSFTSAPAQKHRLPNGRGFGIYRGVTTTFATSDGQMLRIATSPKLEAKATRLRRQLACQQKGSGRRAEDQGAALPHDSADHRPPAGLGREDQHPSRHRLRRGGARGPQSQGHAQDAQAKARPREAGQLLGQPSPGQGRAQPLHFTLVLEPLLAPSPRQGGGRWGRGHPRRPGPNLSAVPQVRPQRSREPQEPSGLLLRRVATPTMRTSTLRRTSWPGAHPAPAREHRAHARVSWLVATGAGTSGLVGPRRGSGIPGLWAWGGCQSEAVPLIPAPQDAAARQHESEEQEGE